MFEKILRLFKKNKAVMSKREYMTEMFGVDFIEMGLLSKDFFDFNQTKLSEFLIKGGINYGSQNEEG